MADFDEQQEITISAHLGEGETTVFKFRDSAGMESEGLVIRFKGELHAFQNLCRHQPLPLDYGDGEFVDESGQYLLCRNHAALFKPDTGFCVSGPCAGASLFKYPVDEPEAGRIVVRIPVVEIDLE